MRICYTTNDDHDVLVDTIATTGSSHTFEYLTDISSTTINKTETRYECRVVSFVTDNAFNMARMCEELSKNENTKNIIFYGCSAHILNLLAYDLSSNYDSTTKHLVHIIKYFRNHHLLA